MDKFALLAEELQELQSQTLYRKCLTIDSAQGVQVQIKDRNLTIFCSNDYLNLAGDSHLVEAAQKAVAQWGWGSAASRLISGTMRPHIETEQAFAEFFGKDSALFFGSGWNANQSVLTTLPAKGDMVLIDRLDHASIIDAVRVGSAAFHTYRRDQLERLEKYLADKTYRQKYIVTESVFSMDGDAADLVRLVELKNKYNAILIVDEAHSVGCMGTRGAGLAEKIGVLDEIDILVAPLGKGPGCGGAIVASKRVVIDYLINKARPFIFSTAPSPVCAAVAKAALEVIISQPQRRTQLADNAEYLRRGLEAAGCNIGSSASHIVPVILGSADKAIQTANYLFEKGFFVSAIRPPTVPAGTERLRISVQCNHSRQQIDALCQAIRQATVKKM